MELIDCVDGLMTGPRPGWTPEDDHDTDNSGTSGDHDEHETQVM
ncbi:hypothetical protein L841_3250 [Mycobacterium sp. MAC_080597_8934]|jgi:hypothetical protein|nr:hypothetical protein L841_3250 [Mycobacterium sp. MAC_080597_8934]ETZ71967.1 hypothetical protein L840_1444 [Mycobacterium sp. MAC_011194_8550]SKQ82354.1 Uncharacterised protein [Mycobacteroides abscessus subsp. massiliense]